jgi:hypothetical protein
VKSTSRKGLPGPEPGNPLSMPNSGATTARRPAAPNGPQHSSARKPGSGPNPFVVAGAAFAAGSLLAKLIDWRSHAHPRR